MDGPGTIGFAALLVAYFSIAFYCIEVRRWQILITLASSCTGGLLAFVIARELARALL